MDALNRNATLEAPLFSTFPGVWHSSGSAGGSEVLRLHMDDIRERTDHTSAGPGRARLARKNLGFVSDFLRGATSEQRVVLLLEGDAFVERFFEDFMRLHLSDFSFLIHLSF